METGTTQQDGARMTIPAIRIPTEGSGSVQRAVHRSAGSGSNGVQFDRMLNSIHQNHSGSAPRQATLTGALNRISDRSREINSLLDALVSGRTMNSGQLLAVQGIMMNFNRDLTAVSKIIDLCVNGIKTTLNTQV